MRTTEVPATAGGEHPIRVRLDSLHGHRTPMRRQLLGFAHRGASVAHRENTIEAFRSALQMGANGLESDVWITGDGVAVLDHDGYVIRGTERVPIGLVSLAKLPSHVPTVDQFYRELGTDFDFQVDIMDVAAVPPLLASARSAGGDAGVARLWLTHPDRARLQEWRSLDATVQLLWDAEAAVAEIPECLDQLVEGGIHALNLRQTQWTRELAAECRRRGLFIVGWGADTPDVLNWLLDIGLDAVVSDHIELMMSAIEVHTWPDPTSAAIAHPQRSGRARARVARPPDARRVPRRTTLPRSVDSVVSSPLPDRE